MKEKAPLLLSHFRLGGVFYKERENIENNLSSKFKKDYEVISKLVEILN